MLQVVAAQEAGVELSREEAVGVRMVRPFWN
jgi:hypothetical protein